MNFESAASMQGDFWRPLTTVWEQRIEACKTSRARFDRIRRQCMAHYDSTAGFMWDQNHKNEFFGGSLPDPKFKITINKAFEFVSIYGPSLFWQYPHRKVEAQRALQLTPEIFGDPNDPAVQDLFGRFMAEDQQEQARQRFINQMMEIYLGWSQREQPAGLTSHAMMAITEALLTGRGVLWPETYYFPGTESPYTRLQYGSVANLYIDPDCNDPHLNSAGYIMRRHVTPIWQVERIFDLPKGSLRGKGSHMSGEQSVRERANQKGDDKGKPTFDCIEWYEIWSKVGVGPRLNGHDHAWLDSFDETVGDYAYLCIAPHVGFPLNSPPERYFGDSAWSEQQVQEAFEWRAPNFGHPFPIWRDNRWPVALLDFNPLAGSPWPVAPLAPGLGELIALNVLMSSYVDQAWENRKTILAYLKSAAEDVREALESDAAFIKVGVNDNMQKSVRDIMEILQRPEANRDILQAIQMMRNRFDEAVGLNELMYGNEGSTQVRVAADIRERSARSSVRPDKMALDVAAWLSGGSQLEMFLAAQHVKGDSLSHLLGSVGGRLWDNEFSGMPPNVLLREMKATVEASEVRRPNKERDTANVQSLQQYLLPLYQQFAQETGDTAPLNSFLDQMGDAMEMEAASFHLPPWQPPVDAEQQQLQQAAQHLDLEKTAAEVEDKQASATQKQAAAQKAMVDAAATMVDANLADGDVREMEHEQDLRHKEQSHQQGLIHEQETHLQKLLFGEMDQSLNEAAAVSAATNGDGEER